MEIKVKMLGLVSAEDKKSIIDPLFSLCLSIFILLLPLEGLNKKYQQYNIQPRKKRRAYLLSYCCTKEPSYYIQYAPGRSSGTP